MVYKLMASIVMAYIVTAYIVLVYVAMAYIFVGLYSYGLCCHGGRTTRPSRAHTAWHGTHIDGRVHLDEAQRCRALGVGAIVHGHVVEHHDVPGGHNYIYNTTMYLAP